MLAASVCPKPVREGLLAKRLTGLEALAVCLKVCYNFSKNRADLEPPEGPGPSLSPGPLHRPSDFCFIVW